MTGYRILIVEDEQIVAMELQRRLESLGYRVSGVAASASEAFEILDSMPVDLVLMDIVLSGKRDGIDAAQIVVDDYHKAVLFLTAHSHREIVERAKRAGAYGYIIKPFDERELQVNIEIALQKHQNQQQYIQSLMSRVTPGHSRRVTVRADDEVVLINPHHLLYLEVQDGVVTLATRDQQWRERGTLAEWEQRLNDYPFFRCHKSFLVNMEKIQRLVLGVDQSYCLVLEGTDKRIPLARGKTRALKTKLAL